MLNQSTTLQSMEQTVIVIQLKPNHGDVTEDDLLPKSTSALSKKHRSFRPILQEVQPYIKSKQRPNPKPIQHVDNNINQLDGWISKCEHFAWSMLRYKNSHNLQVIPAWKGFFFEVSPTANDQYVVGYLPMIRSSPTKIETVKEVLVQCKEKATQLGLTETDLVLDHAI